MAMLGTKLVSTLDLSREEWLEWRKKGIGGSDAAGIVGLNQYTSPLRVYLEKLSLIPEKEDNEAMRQGRDFEDYVAIRFAEASGRKVRRFNAMLQHPEHIFMLANVDRMVVGEEAGLECKTTSVYNKTDFAGGDVPAYYYVQCQHYMAVTGYQKWYLAVLVLNQGFYWFEVDRNEEDIEALIKAESEFWNNHVLKEIPPEALGGESEEELIKTLYPEAKDEQEIYMVGHEEKAAALVNLKKKIKELENEESELTNFFKQMLGDASAAKLYGYKVSWKNSVRTDLDKTALKNTLPDIYKQFTRSSVTRRFELKEVPING